MQFLLDTGAAKTCFDGSLKSEVGSLVGTATFRTPAGPQQTSLFQCPEARIGSHSLSDVKTVGCIDLMPIRYATGLEIYGIVGADFCIGKVLEIDFDAGSIAFGLMPAETLPSTEVVDLPVRIVAGVPHVPIELPGGKIEWIAIDTGANRTAIRATLFDELASSGDVAYMSSHRSVSLGGVSRSRYGKLSFLKLGTQQINDIIVDGDSLSLFGLDQLSRFQLRIDLQDNKLSLCQGNAFSKRSPDATSGMSIIQDRGLKIIIGVKNRGPAFDAGVMAGDEILKVNGKAATSIDMFELRELLTYGPGKFVAIEIRRGEKTTLARLKLSAVGHP